MFLKGVCLFISGNLGLSWTSEANEAFEKKKQCLIKQYSSYYYADAGLYVNGAKTLGENIADNGAMKPLLKALGKCHYVVSVRY